MSGNERPGGWVPGIGWVALLHDLTGKTYFQAAWGDDATNYWRSPADTYRTNVPVIVTRWADGSIPEPPGAWEQLCAAVDAMDDLARDGQLPEPLRQSVEGALVDLNALAQHTREVRS